MDLAGLAGIVWRKLQMPAAPKSKPVGAYLASLLKAKPKAKRLRWQIRCSHAGPIQRAEFSYVRAAELRN